MQRTQNKAAIAAAVVCGLTGVTLGDGNTADVSAQVEAMRQQLNDANAQMQTMKAELSQLKAGADQNWLNERRAEEVKTLVREVLNDADTRASLMATGMTAGYNKNFFLASEDGTFLLKVGGRVQVRYIANFRDEEDAGTLDDENETGFQIRRVKPFFSGYIGSPKFEYHVVLAADRNSTTAGLEEATIAYALMDDLQIKGGRFKAPFLHEELVSSGKQLAVERSLFNEVFTTGFTEGVALNYTREMWRVSGMFNDGQNAGEISTGRQPSVTPAVGGNDFQNDLTDFALTGRFDLKLAGDWKQWEEFAAWSGEEMAIFLGAAVHYERGETGSNTGNTTFNNNFLQWTVDGQFKMSGFNVYAAIAGRHDLEREGANATAGTGSGDATENFDDYGAVVQLGYMVIPDKLEPFARYEWISTDDDRAAGLDDSINIVTVGANYYFIKHNSKFTFDLVWALNPLTAANIVSTSTSGLGLLNDVGDSEDQIAVRAQFQLQF
jgi:phosphate-selective porin OprO and OprP